MKLLMERGASQLVAKNEWSKTDMVDRIRIAIGHEQLFCRLSGTRSSLVILRIG